MILVLIGFLILSNVLTLLSLYFERRYAVYCYKLANTTDKQLDRTTMFYEDFISDMEEEIRRLRGE